MYQHAEGGIDRFRDDLFYATRTLVSASLFIQTAPVPFVRPHLGSHPDVIEEILHRWQAAGLHTPCQKRSAATKHRRCR
ncbi:hypothetical protein [Mycobacterium decipiens]|uniref:Uncharacterized protein n=1 Tax=Mycobacterium decipiens TaxID=1430326 RepID=A0A1X2LZ66_9MYCO|nr:hypothetical protein [Mycobacterium decipiens]OSC42488.1 hypothetical protein B8W66_02705 [Mycobacterium decipiens]